VRRVGFLELTTVGVGEGGYARWRVATRDYAGRGMRDGRLSVCLSRLPFAVRVGRSVEGGRRVLSVKLTRLLGLF
jgi:hypothetical protein